MTGSEVVVAALWAVLVGSLAVVAYVYAGYPLLLLVLRRFRRMRVVAAPTTPTVSVIVAAYNEERALPRKLQNLLTLDYPPDRVEILVASDGSTDGTGDVVRALGAARVRLLELPRGGKTRAINAAAAAATGDVLVMTDATTAFTPDTLARLVEPLADARVGCVAADLTYAEGASGVARGTGAYWRYERWLRALEADVSGVIGCSGALYAVRRALFQPVHAELDDDFTMPGVVYARGFMTALGHGAISHEEPNEDEDADFRMRVRVATRAVNALVRRREVMNPLRFGLFAWQMFSHKALRYLAPVFLVTALCAHVGLAILAPSWAVAVLGVGHVGVYAVAGLGAWSQRGGVRLPLVHIPYYFVLVNAAALVALARYAGGDRAVTWETKR